MIDIVTPRFRLRDLTVDDVTARYLGWFTDAAATRFITAAADTRTLAELRDYVGARTGRPDVVFLGIFDKTTHEHIGNIKYEPVDSSAGFAIMASWAS